MLDGSLEKSDLEMETILDSTATANAVAFPYEDLVFQNLFFQAFVSDCTKEKRSYGHRIPL